MPYYALAHIQQLARINQVIVLEKAQDMAINEYGYMLSNIIDCVLDLAGV